MHPVQATKRTTEESIGDLIANIERVVHGKPEAIRLAVAALLGRGHLLLEDVPGVGKTTLARALARSIDGSFRRIQCTSDLLPADLLGVSIFDPATRAFEFRPGPIFANVVLADELNRAMPKTQGALLEAMTENRVSFDGQSHDLPLPFLVLATQNPAEYHGTFPLPESQLDRFMMRLPLGYPARDAERRIVRSLSGSQLTDDLRPVLGSDEVRAMQDEVDRVRVAEPVVDYVLDLAAASRADPELRLGVSPRGAQTLYRAAQSLALVRGRRFVVPEDVQELAVPVLAHRVLVAEELVGSEATDAGERIIRRLVAALPVPL